MIYRSFQHFCFVGVFIVLIVQSFFGWMSLTYAEPLDDQSLWRTQVFRVSAYYSPLPGQEEYVRGSYEADVLLNGSGKNAADGTAVYPGMLAAPPSYTFGTQLYIPGLGIGTVHDRGSAIGETDTYHRIDVWMGYGDVGRRQALEWGIRSVEGRVYIGSEVLDNTIALDPRSMDMAGMLSSEYFFMEDLEKGMSGQEVVKLQTRLKEMGYFSYSVTGNFGLLTQQAVLDFQLHYNVVGGVDEAGAGRFGPQTRTAMNYLIQQQFAVSVTPTPTPVPTVVVTPVPSPVVSATPRIPLVMRFTL